jgi:hypothetical protein
VLAFARQLRDHRPAAGLLPEPFGHQRRPDPTHRNLDRGIISRSTMALVAKRNGEMRAIPSGVIGSPSAVSRRPGSPPAASCGS